MAERYARDEAPLVIHPTEASIHEHFNNINIIAKICDKYFFQARNSSKWSALCRKSLLFTPPRAEGPSADTSCPHSA